MEFIVLYKDTYVGKVIAPEWASAYFEVRRQILKDDDDNEEHPEIMVETIH